MSNTEAANIKPHVRAIIEAMGAFPFNSQSRKIVLVLTDSGRRQLQQATDDAVIARAVRDTARYCAAHVGATSIVMSIQHTRH